MLYKSDKVLSGQDLFITFDIGLSAALISLGYELKTVDKTNIKKSKFVFKRDEHIDKMINEFWSGKLLLPARTLIENIKMLKNRIYSM